MRPAATCAANTQTDDRWLQLLTNKPAAGPAPPVSLPGAHLLNRASRCSLRLCSALWASTTEDSKRTALLVSIVDPLQSVTAPNESPLTAKRNIRTRTALISSSSCGQKQTVDMLTRQEEATLRVKRLICFILGLYYSPCVIGRHLILGLPGSSIYPLLQTVISPSHLKPKFFWLAAPRTPESWAVDETEIF